MTVSQELRLIQKRMTELLGKYHPDCIMLAVLLSCRNCQHSVFKGKVNGEIDVWECTKFGRIPKQHIDDGCDQWRNNVAKSKPGVLCL